MKAKKAAGRKINLAWVAARLTAADLEKLVALKKENPQLAKLRKRRDTVAAKLAQLDKQIAALGGAAPAASGKPGRPAKAAAPKKPGRKPDRKPGRPAKVAAAAKTVKAPKAPKAVKAPKALKPAKAVKAAKPASRRRGGANQYEGLLPAMKNAMLALGRPVRAGEILDRLVAGGFPMKDKPALMKYIATVLAMRKKDFKRLGKGLYKLA